MPTPPPEARPTQLRLVRLGLEITEGEIRRRVGPGFVAPQRALCLDHREGLPRHDGGVSTLQGLYALWLPSSGGQVELHLGAGRARDVGLTPRLHRAVTACHED